MALTHNVHTCVPVQGPGVSTVIGAAWGSVGYLGCGQLTSSCRPFAAFVPSGAAFTPWNCSAPEPCNPASVSPGLQSGGPPLPLLHVTALRQACTTLWHASHSTTNRWRQLTGGGSCSRSSAKWASQVCRCCTKPYLGIMQHKTKRNAEGVVHNPMYAAQHPRWPDSAERTAVVITGCDADSPMSLACSSRHCSPASAKINMGHR